MPPRSIRCSSFRRAGRLNWVLARKTLPTPLAGCCLSCYIYLFFRAKRWQEPVMYAVFEDGSRQYRVSEGDVVRLDYRASEVGTRLELGRVLLYLSGDDTRIGQP